MWKIIKSKSNTIKSGVFRCLIVLLFSINLYSQQKDTITYKVIPLEINSSRILSDVSLKYYPNSIITQKQIQSLGSIQIPDALQYNAGMYIKNYGGLGGMKTISIRNTSSSQNVVLINGLRLSSSQNSIVDLSNIPISLFSEIEVLRGGNSALYGGGAIGGAINLITENSDINPELHLTFGSFGEFQTLIKSGFLIDNTAIISNLEYTTSKGNYPFSSDQYGEEKQFSRTNGNYMNLSLANSINTNIGRWNFYNLLLLRTSERGLPGAVIQGQIQNDSANLADSEIWWFSNLNRKLNHFSEIKLSLFGKLNQSIYKDPQTFRNIDLLKENVFFNRELQFQSKYIIYDSTNYLDFQFEMFYANLSGDMLNQKLNSFVERYGLAIGTKLETNILKSKITDATGLLSFRTDIISYLQPAYSSSAATLLDFKKTGFTGIFQLSANFRPPNFNEMYYLNYGNENLKPENSLNLNLGIKKELFKLINLEFNTFYIDTKDQIVAVAMPGAWSAQNIEKVITQGIEFGLGFITANNLININLNYTLQEAVDRSKDSYSFDKQIIYSPNELINGIFSINFSEFTISSSFVYSSFRYSLPDNTVNSVLPEYLILNFSANINLRFEDIKLILRADISNILDKEYSIIINYPMPGRSFRFSINAKV